MAAVPTTDIYGAPGRPSRFHRQRGLQRDGDSEQDKEPQARHRRIVRLFPYSLSHTHTLLFRSLGFVFVVVGPGPGERPYRSAKLGLKITEKPANAQDRLDAVRLLPACSAREGDPAAPGADEKKPRAAPDVRMANARKPDRDAVSELVLSLSVSAERHHLQSAPTACSLASLFCQKLLTVDI